MRKIASSYIFPITSKPLKQGILVLSDEGEILDIIDTGGKLIESGSLEYYNGIIIPGFVNAHCHIELSYMKNLMKEVNGLPVFIKSVLSSRHTIPADLEEIIKAADDEMKDEGIVAVGDISNDDFSFSVKKNSSLYYHTFIEVFSPSDKMANTVFSKGEKLFHQLNDMGLAASIVPHAPYTMSPKLFQMIFDFHVAFPGIYSVHNQETSSENQLYTDHSGELVDLFAGIGLDLNAIEKTGKTSLQSILHYFPIERNILLVHNIYSSSQDVDCAMASIKKPYFVICPNSNLIIEQKLPDIKMLTEKNVKIAIGTDSYSSNKRLSILEELKTLIRHFQYLNLEDLLKWATWNGASALGLENKLGSFEIGKNPGVNLLTGIDFENMKLTQESKIKVLV